MGFKPGVLNIAKRQSVRRKIGDGVRVSLRIRVQAGKAVGRPRFGESVDKEGRYQLNAWGRRALALRAEKKSLRYIADIVAVHHETVRRFLRRHGRQ